MEKLHIHWVISVEMTQGNCIHESFYNTVKKKTDIKCSPGPMKTKKKKKNPTVNENRKIAPILMGKL